MKRLLLLILVIFINGCGKSDSVKPNVSVISDEKSQVSSSSEISVISDEKSQILSNSEIKGETAVNIEIIVNEHSFSATLYDNETARAFAETLPLGLDMSELNGNEKFFYLSEDLPKNPSVPNKINAGDIMLYGGNCLVIFYESFSTSYSYTPIGTIDDPRGLAEVLGKGNIYCEIKGAP